MLTTTTTTAGPFAGNNVATQFPVAFKFAANSELLVYLVDASDQMTLKTITTHYTVTGAGNPSGGTVTFVTAPTTSERVFVVRRTSRTQSTDYRNQGPWLAQNNEDSHDRAMRLTQELYDRSLLSVRFADVFLNIIDTTITQTPDPYFVFRINAAGTGIEIVSPSDIMDSVDSVDGTGTVNYIPLWTDTNTLANSIISQNAGATLVTVTGNFDITGTHTAGALAVDTSAAIGTTLDVTGATTLNGLVAGATILSSLNVTNDIDCGGDGTFVGLSAATLSTTGSATLGDNIADVHTVNGTMNATAVTALTARFRDLGIYDSADNNYLYFDASENLTADRTLTIVVGDTDRTLTLTGNASISGTSSGTNTGDQTSIVGISGTMAQFNTACSDGDFTFGGGTASGTNTGDVTLAGTYDYITISGQVITRGQIDLATDVTGTLDSANIDQSLSIATLNTSGAITAASDTNTSFVFGRVKFDPALDVVTQDAATFSHIDHSTITGVALYVGPSGDTWVNSETGQSLSLGIGGATKVSINATNVDFTSLDIQSATWKGSVIAGQYGGTGVANTGMTITLAGNFATSGANSLTLTTTGATNVTLPTSGTLVNSAVTTLSSLVSIGTVTTGTWNASVIGLTYGGSGKALTASNGGIVYTDSDSMEVLAGTATAGRMLRSGASAAPTWSTCTFPSTGGTASTFLRSDGTNFVNSTFTVPSAAGATGQFWYGDGTGQAVWSAWDLPTGTLTANRMLYSSTTTRVIQTTNLTWNEATLAITGAFTLSGNATLGDAIGDAHTLNGTTTFTGPTIRTKGAELTVSGGGAITATHSLHQIQPASGFTDDLDTITAGTNGQLLFITMTDIGDSLSIRHVGGGTGNIYTSTATTQTLSWGRTAMFMYSTVSNTWHMLNTTT